VNFLLQLVVVLLAFEVALILFGSSPPAFFAAALWGVHPMAADVVPNIAGRADLLAVAAIFGCLLLHRCSPRPISVLLFFVVALLGALSKETALLLPVLLLLFDALEGKSLIARLRQKLPYYVASIAAAVCMLAARHAVLQQRPWPIPPYF